MSLLPGLELIPRSGGKGELRRGQDFLKCATAPSVHLDTWLLEEILESLSLNQRLGDI